MECVKQSQVGNVKCECEVSEYHWCWVDHKKETWSYCSAPNATKWIQTTTSSSSSNAATDATTAIAATTATTATNVTASNTTGSLQDTTRYYRILQENTALFKQIQKFFGFSEA